MADPNSSKAAGLESPAEHAVAITPDNSTDLATYTRALYIGVAGDVKVDMAKGGTVTFKDVPIGILPVRAKRVYDTGTTATNILGLW